MFRVMKACLLRCKRQALGIKAFNVENRDCFYPCTLKLFRYAMCFVAVYQITPLISFFLLLICVNIVA